MAGPPPSTAADEDSFRRLRGILDDGRYTVAENEARRMLASAEAEGGSDALRVAKTVDFLVEALLQGRKQARPETRQLAERAVTSKERLLGPASTEVATSLLNLATVLAHSGAEAEARELLDRALAIRTAVFGEEHPEIAELLARKGHLLILAGEYDEARRTLERSLTVREEALGKDHRDVADSLYLLSYVHDSTGDLGAAERDHERALTIREMALGPDHPDVGWSLRALGAVRLRMSKYDGVVPVLERALSILERTYGPEQEAVLDVRSNLALALGKQSDDDRARAAHESLLEIQERLYGPEDPALLATLMNLGDFLVGTGEISEARKVFQRARSIAETADAGAGEMARHLLNLAVATKVAGDLGEAEALYERSLSLMEQAVGLEHPDVAIILGQFGQCLFDQGRFAEARRRHEQALAILEKAYGSEHRAVAYNRANLGEVYWHIGDTAAARWQTERALEILERVMPAGHGSISYVLGQLGGLATEMGDFEKARECLERKLAMDRARDADTAVAETLIALARLGDREGADPDEVRALHTRALALQERNLGPDHPDVATILVSLARLSSDSGEAGAALPLLVRASKIQERAFGPTHPEVGRTAVELAGVHRLLGDAPRDLDDALRGEQILRDHLRQSLRSLAERWALEYAFSRATGIDLALSVAVDDPSGESIERVWDAVIRSRAIVLDEMAARVRTVGRTGDAEIDRFAHDLALARVRLAHVMVQGPDDEQLERYRATIEQARRAREQAERALAEKSVAFREALDRENAGWVEVSRALPERTALVAFVRYDRIRPVPQKSATGGTRQVLETTPSYVALVLRSKANVPAIVPLGSVEEIDAHVAAWRGEVGRKPPAGRAARERAEQRYREAGAALTRAVWDPVAGKLHNVRQVFVVPDGELQLVNLSTLPVATDRYLVETDLVVHTLSAERDLVRTEPIGERGQGLLAVGSPDYDTPPGPPPETPGTDTVWRLAATGDRSREVEVYRGPSAACGDFRARRFEPLPASLEEVEEIAESWMKSHHDDQEDAQTIVTLTGPEAHERVFKLLAPGRRVLHLATHGFFLGQDCRSAADGVPAVDPGRGLPAEAWTVDNPLLLSGLALAGFNRRDAVEGGLEDGVLTSEEIASLDLAGVEWVVLSACGTGLGQVRPREGVLGLRRAFQVAGAGSLIMSLWSIQDEAALEWMGQLYAGRRDGLSTAEAVHEASATMLERRRRRGRSTHPFYWGAFVAVGDWR